MSVLSDYCVGLLSRADANTLIGAARGSRHGVLEFGSGGSTLLFAQFAAGVDVISVDSAGEWVEKTKSKLNALDEKHGDAGQRGETYVNFVALEGWLDKMHPLAWFDVIFVDGKDEHRSQFAHDAWRFLTPTGKMIFHDARLPSLGRDAAMEIVKERFMEISSVEICPEGSNMVVVTKCVDRLRYDDHAIEGRQAWESGFADVPAGWGGTRR